MSVIESDLSGLTLEQLRALADECLAQAHDELFAGHGQVIQLLIVLLEAGKRGEQAAPPAWQAGDVAWAAVSPLTLYYQPGPGRSQALAVTWAMDVLEVKGEWLRVTKDGRWAWYADCKKEP